MRLRNYQDSLRKGMAYLFFGLFTFAIRYIVHDFLLTSPRLKENAADHFEFYLLDKVLIFAFPVLLMFAVLHFIRFFSKGKL